MQSCGKSQPTLTVAQRPSVVSKFHSLTDFFLFIYFFRLSLLVDFLHSFNGTATCLFPLTSVRAASWFQKCVESGFGYHGDEKRGSEGVSSNSLYF